jgi:hypothetical protein
MAAYGAQLPVLQAPRNGKCCPTADPRGSANKRPRRVDSGPSPPGFQNDEVAAIPGYPGGAPCRGPPTRDEISAGISKRAVAHIYSAKQRGNQKGRLVGICGAARCKIQ